MSGLGPAACWLTHKKIESWSRMAKERVSAVRRISEDRDRSRDSVSSSPPTSASTSLTNDSQDLTSSMEVSWKWRRLVFCWDF